MIDLEKTSGLPISLDGEIIQARDGFDLPMPAFRKLEDFKEVLKEGSLLTGPEIAYTMFRAAEKDADKRLFESKDQRYDITVIAPGSVGEEYVKTIGHYHSKKEGTDVYYPEVYEVNHGALYYLIQKVESGKLLDVKIISAKSGDKVVIPPGYGHITINPSDETLVEADVQCLKIVSNYEDVAKMQGFAFYLLESGEWVKNENYENVDDFKPNVINARDAKDVFGIQNDIPLYIDFIKDSEKYDFLENPEKYLEKFEQIWS